MEQTEFTPEEIIKIIKKDYNLTQSIITEIITNKKNNTLVINPDYTTPTTRMDINLPLSDENGSFIYFQKIRNALEDILSKGYITYDKLPKRSPKYICDFMR